MEIESCCCGSVQSKKLDCFSSGVDLEKKTTLECELCQRLTEGHWYVPPLLPDLVRSCEKLTPETCGKHLRHIAQQFEADRRKLKFRSQRRLLVKEVLQFVFSLRHFFDT